jgi:hypothetical protein
MTGGDAVRPARWEPITAVAGLLGLATLTFLAASVIHFGVRLPLGVVTIYDPFSGAALPEAIIAAVLAGGLVTVVTKARAAWWVALTATVFGVLGVIVGVSVILGRQLGRSGDLVYHATMLVELLLTLGVLLTPQTRRALGQFGSRNR